jgi:DNA gyrase/topoisomerase IV subunit A
LRVPDDNAIEAQRIAARTEVVEAQVWAAEHPDDLLDIVTSAATGADALRRLTEGPNRFTEFQAQFILDTPFRRLTRENVAQLREGLERLRRGDMTPMPAAGPPLIWGAATGPTSTNPDAPQEQGDA